jgi:hypothetical protein
MPSQLAYRQHLRLPQPGCCISQHPIDEKYNGSPSERARRSNQQQTWSGSELKGPLRLTNAVVLLFALLLFPFAVMQEILLFLTKTFDLHKVRTTASIQKRFTQVPKHEECL